MRRSTKDKILDSAHRLFNRKGLAGVTMRQIAQEAGMSHGNLTYHYRTKEELVVLLHERLLAAAEASHKSLMKEGVTFISLMATLESGFDALYEYRFFMRDLNFIMREYKQVHRAFLKVEKVRSDMYEHAFDEAINAGLMRDAEYEGEYSSLITRIRIFSDYWISSAEIYESKGKRVIISTYSRAFRDMLYPYFSAEGKAEMLARRDAD